MDQKQGVLFLADPLAAGADAQKQLHNTASTTLIFDENGRYLSLAQTALWRMRAACGWICVAAQGHAAGIALALAAQLPVDRLVLNGSRIFSPDPRAMPRELIRLNRYARRNLSLIISDLLLIGAPDGEIRGMARAGRHFRLCALEEDPGRDAFTAPWGRLCENNLLIPGKCV